jgi:hypothetical protein
VIRSSSESLAGVHARAYLDRRSRGQKHPVHDFLFTYYPFPATRLLQWVPAVNQAVPFSAELFEEMPWLERQPHLIEEDCYRLDSKRIPSAVLRAAEFISKLSQAILDRPPRFSCFGLHEWAMVYRQSPEQIRHQGYELRLSPEQLARFIESQTLCCTHFDAFRFYTPEARPLNTFQPTLDTRIDLEQSGCLHANMDTYKWAGKLWPWAGADLLAETFELAWAGRELDMRASPYELRALGYEPIAIETAEGREQYRLAQQDLQERSKPVRRKLLAAAELILSTCNHNVCSLSMPIAVP